MEEEPIWDDPVVMATPEMERAGELRNAESPPGRVGGLGSSWNESFNGFLSPSIVIPNYLFFPSK